MHRSKTGKVIECYKSVVLHKFESVLYKIETHLKAIKWKKDISERSFAVARLIL